MGAHKEALSNNSLADQMLHSFTLQYITSCRELLKGGQSWFLKALVSKNVAGEVEGINQVKLLMFNQKEKKPHTNCVFFIKCTLSGDSKTDVGHI